MTRKSLVTFHRLFNELVQKEVNGRPAYRLVTHPIDFCGGNEVVLHCDTIIWFDEITALNTICEKLCLSARIELSESRIIIH